MNSQAAVRNGSGARALKRGREAFQTRAWATAFSELLAADTENPLEPQDLILLAQAAQLIAKEVEGADYLARAHQAFLSRGDTQLAARCAFWLGFTSMVAGEMAKASGWLSRASRLLEGRPDCVEHGYLLLAAGYRSFHTGDAIAAHAALVQAAAIGQRFQESDLVTLALQGQGRALIRQGETTRGVALLDEAMVAVTAGEVSPLSAGGVYCSVLEGCGEIFDVQRAQEWTLALEKWCASQPDLVPFRGHCLLRRAELLQLHGAWSDALAWAQQAIESLSRPTPKPAVGAAYYQLAEIHRLRGNFSDSEEAYRQASQSYRSFGPGLAQLRLAQGRVDAANEAIRRIAEEVRQPGPRAGVLEAFVEIVLAAKDLTAARAGAEELAEIAARQDAPLLYALSARAWGAVLLAEGNPSAALAALRKSWTIWCELQAPYEAARVRLLIASACRALGDDEDARLEGRAARETFHDLGAVVELSAVEALLSGDAQPAAGQLTQRELQVLRLVATGMTNREIAGKLQISGKTVARHLSNIFTKLDLSSRSAATAYAYDHQLV